MSRFPFSAPAPAAPAAPAYPQSSHSKVLSSVTSISPMSQYSQDEVNTQKTIRLRSSQTPYRNGLMGITGDSDADVQYATSSNAKALVRTLRAALFPTQEEAIHNLSTNITAEAMEEMAARRRSTTVRWILHIAVVGLIALFFFYKLVHFSHAFGVEYSRFSADQAITRELHKNCVDPRLAVSDACAFQRHRLTESAVLVSFDHAINQVLNDTVLYIWIGSALRQVMSAAAPWLSIVFPVLIVAAIVILIAMVSHVYRTTVFGLAKRTFISKRSIDHDE